jgi:hypothetical protein
MPTPSAQDTERGNPAESAPEIAVRGASDSRLTVRRDLGTFETSIAQYPEAVKPGAAWLYQYMMQKCNGAPAIVAAQLRKIDPKTYPNREQYIYQVTTGRYFKHSKGEKAIAVFLDIIAALRRHEMLAEQTGRIAFNEELSSWIDLKNYIDRKRARETVCKFGAIEGDTGTGKTKGTKHYQLLNNHGSTVRFEAPSTPSLPRFLVKLGACYNILPGVRTHERVTKIEENVNETRTIIVENVQRLYNVKTGPYQPIFSYLQELQDDTDCTIILTWTPVFRNELLRGKDHKFFEQFVSRIGGIDDVLSLDRRLPKKDLASIAEQFEVDDFAACYPLLNGWALQPGPLRMVYSRLQKAKVLARGKVVTLDHLEAVDCEPVETGAEGGTR